MEFHASRYIYMSSFVNFMIFAFFLKIWCMVHEFGESHNLWVVKVYSSSGAYMKSAVRS